MVDTGHVGGPGDGAVNTRDPMPRGRVRNFTHFRREKQAAMRQIVIEIAAAAALTVASILASAVGAKAGDLSVTHAYARASASPAAKAATVYVTVANAGAGDDRIVAVSTPVARAAMLHRTAMSGDVMKMEHVESVAVPANAAVEMAPGGLHVMLMGLAAPLKEGETLQLTLTFEKSEPVTVDVPVRGVAAGP